MQQFLWGLCCEAVQFKKYKDMNFPAQSAMIAEEPVEKEPIKMDLTSVVRAKYESVKSKGQLRIDLTRRYRPTDQSKNERTRVELLELIANSNDGANADAERFLPFLLGSLEGSQKGDYMLILGERFGSRIENLRIEEAIKDNIKSTNYGQAKSKEMCLFQISDKKMLEAVGEYYDLREIKAHRKVCAAIKAYSKAMKKFMEIVEKNGEKPIDQENEAYMSYIQYVQEEMVFNKLKTPVFTEEKQKIEKIEDKMIDESEEKKQEDNKTPLKERVINPSKKSDSALTLKNEQDEAAATEAKQKRRTKEEVERERVEKQKEREMKTQEKERERLAKQQKKERERLEKEKQKQAEKLAKDRERQAKQKEKQAKELEKKRQLEMKQAERIKKEKKNAPGPSILKFFKKSQNETQSPAKLDKPESNEEPIEVQHPADKLAEFLATINQQLVTLEDCKSQFKQEKMKEQTPRFEPYFVSIFTHRSRLEFTNFLVNEERCNQYTQPHEENDIGKYDDSSVEYEDLCGDICNEDIEEASFEEEAESNSAIVPDSYLSGDEMSSVDESKDKVIVSIGEGGEWSFAPHSDIPTQFTMICLFEDEAMPLALSSSEQSNEVTNMLKCELYKEIHGHYGHKEPLLKKLQNIADKVPKSYLVNLLRETTTKKNNQRLVKPEIIDFLNEQREGFARQLEEIKLKRNEEIQSENRLRVNERERQMERLILEEAGTYYIIDLLQFLREKGYRMTKRDLTNFIEARVGSQWDDIRKRMKKMQFKDKSITPFLKKEDKDKKEDDDEDYHPPEEQAMKQE